MSIPVPEYGQCPWPLDPACLSDEWDLFDAEVQERATMLASATLHRLTGYRVGGCPITVRPCKASCAIATIPPYLAGVTQWMMPHINTQGMWINSCGCATDCSCTEVCEILLPEPVGEIYEVSLNGTILDPTDYRTDSNRLVWVGDDTCPWPACQDMNADLTEDNTFSVTYLNSYPPDRMAAYAAGVLAMEYAKACTGNKCRLPSTVTGVSRQGVSFDIPTGAFPDGFTGIREVDAYIALWNPGGMRQRAVVWSPDITTPRVVQ